MIQDHLKKFNGKIAAVTSLYYFIFVVYLVLCKLLACYCIDIN